MKLSNQFSQQVSIIVPIFNTDQYLDRCIKSIVDQITDVPIEIILINDGSTDLSGTICDAWAKRDSRIHLIHKENEGVTKTRRIGVEHASSEWICFVDSDDELPKDSIQTLFEYVNENVDIIIGSVKFIGKQKWPYKARYEELDTLQYIKSLLKCTIHSGPCARLIRKRLFAPHTLDISADIKIGEDLIMNIHLAQKANRIILLPDVVYYYIWRQNSAVSQYRNLERKDRVMMDNLISNSIQAEYKESLKKAIYYYYIIRRWWFVKSIVKRVLKINNKR